MRGEMEGIRFLPNALIFGGKREKVHYSQGNYTESSGIPKDAITIYAKGYGSKLPNFLNPENESDIITDYFDKDKARIYPSSPFFPAVKAAHDKANAHDKKMQEKRLAKARQYDAQIRDPLGFDKLFRP